MLRKLHSNPPRQYGDVSITHFDCGCVLVAKVSDPYVTELKAICKTHAKFLDE